jgi:hypothetical protein
VRTEVYCQKNTYSLSVIPSLHHQPIAAGIEYPLDSTCSVRIDQLRFYLSDIRFYHSKKRIGKDKTISHLIDISIPESGNITTTVKIKKNINQIQFLLGTDSATNTKGAQAGNLDPSNGMYWTWQTGYIHLKMEGVITHTEKEPVSFQLHIGGYSFPYNSSMPVSLNIANQNPMVIYFELLPFIKQLDANTNIQIMSPGSKAVALAAQLAGQFQTNP